MHRRLQATLAFVAAVAAALLLMLWASMGGPVSVTSHAGPPAIHTPNSAPTPKSPARAGARPHHHPVGPPARHDLGWLGEALTVLIVTGLGLLVLWLLRRWHEVATRYQRARDVDFEAGLPSDKSPSAIRTELVGQYAGQLAALTELPPRNGIVQAWVLFEQAAAQAGAAREPSETATDFVVRLLHLLDIDPATVGRLRGLYVEARFSEHPTGVQQRDQARAALEAIHAELEATAKLGGAR